MPVRLRDDERQRVVDRGRAGVGVTLGAGRARRVVVRLGAVGERVHRRADGRVERKVEGQLRVVDRGDRLRALVGAAALPAGLEQHPEVRRPLGAGVGRRDGDDRAAGRRARPTASSATTALHVSIALPPPSPTRPSASSSHGQRPRASRTVSTGTCDADAVVDVRRRAAPGARGARARDVTSSGRAIPTSAQTSPSSPSVPAPKRDHALGRGRAHRRVVRRRARGRSRATPPARARTRRTRRRRASAHVPCRGRSRSPGARSSPRPSPPRARRTRAPTRRPRAR